LPFVSFYACYNHGKIDKKHGQKPHLMMETKVSQLHRRLLRRDFKNVEFVENKLESNNLKN